MISQSILDRITQLQAEDHFLDKMGKGQFGTSIPKLFSQNDTFVANPSQVGTSILSRMVDTDDSVSSAVQFKILMIMAKIGEYQHERQEITEFVNEFMKKMKRPTWHEAMEAMLSCKAYGFSASEIIWGLDRKLQQVPVRISTYHPSTMAFEVDQYGSITDDGVIQFVQQFAQFSNPNNRLYGIQWGWQVKNPFVTPTDRLHPYRMPFMNNYGMVRIPRNKVIHLTNLPMFSFGSPYGKTEVRTAHLAWGLKNFLLRQLGIAGKRSANGFIWATAPKGVQNVKFKNPETGREEEGSPIEVLNRMMATRESDDSIVTHPEIDGYKITNVGATANMDQILNAINNLDVRIFRCFLLPSLVMTDGSAGSRSLGDKHFEIVDKVAESESIKFCQAIVNDMIEPAIRANFGEMDDYGGFKQRPQSTEERSTIASMFATLTTSGILKNHVKGDMDYMRQTLSLPKDTDTSFDIGGDVNDPNVQRVDDAPADSDHPLQGGDESVQQSVLNGAQVTPMVTIVQSVATGNLPRESAIEIIMVAFNMTRDQAEKILGEAGNGFTPTGTPAPDNGVKVD